jgi:peptidoglycan hydrolase-like protein with peptidoglycan-binding domain
VATGTGSSGTGGNTNTAGGSGSGGTKPATGAGAGGSTARVTQVVTSIIAVGAPVTLGTVLYAVESKPVIAMSGPLPAWRTLKVGVSDGPDVQQLELNLVALGYDRSNTMKVDGHFDSATKAAVQRWQAGYGLAVTGSVTLGSVVFLPSASTVSAVQTKIGAAIGEGDKVVSLAASNQDVVIKVPTGDEAFVVPGFAVKIGDVDGTVSLLRSATQSGATVVEAVITPAAPIKGTANGATVRVIIQHDGLSGVLLAPAAALASRLDGSYAVQVVDAGGAVSWVQVEVLATANGSVAIRGTGIGEGTKVLQPR